MTKITVQLKERSYPIFIEPGILSQLPIADYLKSNEVLIVTNETIAPLYLESLKKTLPNAHEIILHDGEQYKTLDSFDTIITQLLTLKFSRDATLIALGGGVIGDMTGFAAACYQRGVNFIQVPTTLLSQVDASVGGKTAVNHPLAKNMIGAFHQPQAVFIDTQVLTSLPEREFCSGLAEVVKHALISDAAFFDYLEKNQKEIMQREPEKLSYIIQRCCEIKADIVAKDECEHGCRALLNLGHTFGHSFEKTLGYDKIMHGEAVGYGLLCAVRMSKSVGSLKTDFESRLESLLEAFGLPQLTFNEQQLKEIVDTMKLDKKNKSGVKRFVLLNDIGNAFIYELPGNLDVSAFI